MNRPAFDQAKAAFPVFDVDPDVDRRKLFEWLGGKWPSRVGDKNYRNTCAIRLSVALRDSGVAIPAKCREDVDGAGRSLVLRVATMCSLLAESWGYKDYWGMSKEVGKEVVIPPKKGVVAYRGKYPTATGHCDLWDGVRFVGSGNFDDIEEGYSIELWYL